MRILIFLFLTGLYSGNLFSQAIKKSTKVIDTAMTDTTSSIYKNLDTRKFYNVGMGTNKINGITVYEINNKKVSEATYNKYHSKWNNMVTCKPCILESYDENDQLMSKGIRYTDCIVGFWIEYYPNRKVKLIGHYKENNTGNWKEAWDSDYYCKKDGTWTYFDENGTVTKTEVYKDGKLIY